MAVDLKYGRVMLERGSIGEDEPVVVFRARDKLLPKVLAYYRLFCWKAGSPDHHLGLIDRAVKIVEAWQADHPTRTPQSLSTSMPEQHGQNATSRGAPNE